MGRKAKIQLYKQDRTKNEILNESGDYILDFICTSCSVEENLYEEEYFLDAEFLVDDEGLYKKIEEDMVLKVQLDYGFEIFSIVDIKKTPNRVTVFARQITIAESLCTWLDDVRPEGKNGQDALNHLIENSIGGGNLEVSSDISVVSTAYYVNKSLYEALHTANNSFKNRWGGEVRRRGYKITIDDKIGSPNNVQIRSGRNLTGFEANTNIDTIITRIIPNGYNGITTVAPIDSPLIAKYKYIRTAEVNYKHVKLRSDLGEEEPDESDLIFDSLAEAQNKLEELALLDFLNGVDKLRADYKINFIDLAKTEEYKNYGETELIQLGDEVNVYEEKHDINITVRAIKRTYDVLNQNVVEIELSNYDISEEDQETADAIKQVEDRLDKVVEEVGYLNVNCAKIENLQAVEIKVQKLEADIGSIENLEAVNARIENLEAEKANVTQLDAAVANIVNLNAENANIKNLLAEKATLNEVHILNGLVDNLAVNKAEVQDLKAVEANIDKLYAKDAHIEDLIADIGEIGDLTAINADIERLDADNAYLMNAIVDKANIKDLNAEVGRIDTLISRVGQVEELQADVVTTDKFTALQGWVYDMSIDFANIERMVNGNLTSNNILTLNLVAESGSMANATIARIDAGTITSGIINTNKLTIGNPNLGSKADMVMKNGSLIFYDKNQIPRMQIGRDHLNDFSFLLNGPDGYKGTLITHEGIQSGAFIGDRIISDNHIEENAGIDGSKLNINSVISEINENGDTLLKSSKILFDETGQTLDIQFKQLSSKVDSIGDLEIDGDLNKILDQVSINTTAIEVAQGKIEGLIENTTIEGAYGTRTLKDEVSKISQEIDGITIGMHSLEANYDIAKSDIRGLKDSQAGIELSLEGVTTTVENFEARIEEAESKLESAEEIITPEQITNIVKTVAYSKVDMDSLLNGTINDLKGRIDGIIDGVNDEFNEREGNLSSMQTIVSSQMTQTSQDITMKFTETKTYAEEVENNLREYQKEVETNIRFSGDGIELGKSDSPFKTVLDNEKLAFVQNGEEVAYISNQKMNITNAEIEQELTIGSFSWFSTDGHLRLRRS